MSLINKMLQDLDARGGAQRQGGFGGEVRPVPPPRGGMNRTLMAAGAGIVVLALAAGGWMWWYLRGTPLAEPAPAASTTRIVRPAAQPTPAPAPVATPAPAALPEPPASVATPPEQIPDVLADKLAAPDAAPTKRDADTVRKPQGEPAQAGGTKTAKAARPAGAWKPAAKPAVQAAAPAADAALAAADATPQQRANLLFQRAQARLVDARVNEAIANLEAALQADPRHDAARQTLASVLVEGGRHADAMRHLQQGLALDPRQTGMAMLLARLQLEHGGPAIETLNASLPYAQDNADYRALMAGIMQRAQRHKEAIDQYTAAVQLQPAQGVWWMGLGISLQADQRNADAKQAFTRARESGRLSAELQSFVERKLQQLGN